LIVQILRVVIYAAASLGLTIVVAFSYLVYTDHTERKNKSALLARANSVENANLLSVQSMQLRGADNRQTVIRTYVLVRTTLYSILKLSEKAGQTEREIILNLKGAPLLRASSDALDRIYRVYEYVRFGGATVSEHDLESFLKDVRSLSGSCLDS